MTHMHGNIIFPFGPDRREQKFSPSTNPCWAAGRMHKPFLRKPGTTRLCFKSTMTCALSIPAPFAPFSGKWKRNESDPLLSSRREAEDLSPPCPTFLSGEAFLLSERAVQHAHPLKQTPFLPQRSGIKKASSPYERTGSHDYVAFRN